MKLSLNTLAMAAIISVFAPGVYAQDSASANESKGAREATQMVRARAELLRPVDAKKDQAGAPVEAKLTKRVKLTDGTELPSGTVLRGQVAADDMQAEGTSKLALRFDEARLKNGVSVKVKATIVGFNSPARDSYENAVAEEELPIPNTWNDGTLELNQKNVSGGVDLHSRIASHNSGVFVSTGKDDIVLHKGSEIQFAIGPGAIRSASMNSGGGQ